MTSFTVHCTHCDTAFPVDPDKVPDGGVRARCTRCEGIFFVAKPATADPAPDVAAPEPEIAPPAAGIAVAEPEVAGAAEVDAAPDQDDAGFGSFDDEIELVDSTPEEGPPEAVEDEVRPDPEDDATEDLEVAPPEPAIVDEPPAIVHEAQPVVDEAPPAVEEAQPVVETPPPAVEEAPLVLAEAPPVADEPTEDHEEVPAVPAGFQFGRRDPHEKARRLARVLVSDMITYNPDRHLQALARGTLAEDFEDEIGKSWEEYVDQVGGELAQSTPYWRDALNEVLAKGDDIF
jgi:predicted Zn finger-like uncharacterized protein